MPFFSENKLVHFYYPLIRLNIAGYLSNGVDPDQMLNSVQPDLGYTVYSGLSVCILRLNMVRKFIILSIAIDIAPQILTFFFLISP